MEKNVPEIVGIMKSRIRVKSEEADEEITALIEACESELKLAGVYGDESDALYLQAVTLYCKAHYGYDENVQRFRQAFEALRDAMALSGDYKEVRSDGNSDPDLGGDHTE